MWDTCGFYKKDDLTFFYNLIVTFYLKILFFLIRIGVNRARLRYLDDRFTPSLRRPDVRGDARITMARRVGYPAKC